MTGTPAGIPTIRSSAVVLRVTVPVAVPSPAETLIALTVRVKLGVARLLCAVIFLVASAGRVVHCNWHDSLAVEAGCCPAGAEEIVISTSPFKTERVAPRTTAADNKSAASTDTL